MPIPGRRPAGSLLSIVAGSWRTMNLIDPEQHARTSEGAGRLRLPLFFGRMVHCWLSKFELAMNQLPRKQRRIDYSHH
jgi:hypothetical protein